MESIQKQLQAACEDSGEVQFRNDYSGRMMYGRKCVGITGSWKNCQSVIAHVIGAMTADVFDVTMDGDEMEADDLHNTVQTNIEELMSFSFDQMGHDVIIYWPDLESLSDEELSEGDSLPTDQWIDEQSEQTLLQWVAGNSEHHDGEPVENHGDLIVTAKIVRDRIRESRLT
jgi:hypothetical protein